MNKKPSIIKKLIVFLIIALLVGPILFKILGINNQRGIMFIAMTFIFGVDLAFILSVTGKYQTQKQNFWTIMAIRTLLAIFCLYISSGLYNIVKFINELEVLLFIPAIFYLIENKERFNLPGVFNQNQVGGDVIVASLNDFDPIFKLDEKRMVKEFIKRELKESNVRGIHSHLPSDALVRKTILSLIFVILIFIYISMIFFHFPILTYIVGFIILLVLFIVTVKYSLLKYLTKQVKARPDEKISNIIMNTSTLLRYDYTRLIRVGGSVIAIFLALTIFKNPVILYEPYEDGYAVRYYAYGLNNRTTAEIPSEHNGKPVLALRGNTFSNMFELEEVILPDTIVEIRGQAFLNDTKLVKVKLPANLEYLGGRAFYNATSIKEIELPDTLTELGGESFYNATSLEKIKLSNQLKEIRGSTFENCKNLKAIIIPDSVTRIGGHAFYGNSSLVYVYISPNSKLAEIGSSAFRQCSLLYDITIPSKTYVNEKAFKESPTTVDRY